MTPMVHDGVPHLVDHLFRHQAGRLVSHLVRTLGPAHVDLAEDVVQESLTAALRRWPIDGVPDDPAAWLSRVARNRAIDAVRRHNTLQSKLARLGAGQSLHPETAVNPEPLRFSDELDDDVLRMIFACCDPTIPRDSQAALTLKLACGFQVSEIARAFLTQDSTIAQRIVRAKRQLRSGHIEIDVPGPKDLSKRLRSVLEVLYLIFNEGYSAHQGENLVHSALVEEAIRLTSLLAGRAATALPQSHALLSLMLLHGSRLAARVDDQGRLVLLEDQDRSLWDRRLISAGFHHLGLAAEGDDLSEYHVQAAIAACHASAPTPEETDWTQILSHYDTMMRCYPSPIVQLNRAVALAMVRGPDEGLESLDEIDPASLCGYYLLPATRAELLRRAGRLQDAAVQYKATLQLAKTEPERRFIEDRIRSTTT